jgi:hypothetical protein
VNSRFFSRASATDFSKFENKKRKAEAGSGMPHAICHNKTAKLVFVVVTLLLLSLIHQRPSPQDEAAVITTRK